MQDSAVSVYWLRMPCIWSAVCCSNYNYYSRLALVSVRPVRFQMRLSRNSPDHVVSPRLNPLAAQWIGDRAAHGP
jgi:hypothetical protein